MIPEPVVSKDTQDRRSRTRSAHQSKVLLELHGIKNPNSELAILSISDGQIALALRRIGTVEWISEPGWKVSKNWLNHGRPANERGLASTPGYGFDSSKKLIGVTIHQNALSLSNHRDLEVVASRSQISAVAIETSLPFQFRGEGHGLLISTHEGLLALLK